MNCGEGINGEATMAKRPGFAAESRTTNGDDSSLTSRSSKTAGVEKCGRRITVVVAVHGMIICDFGTEASWTESGGQDSPKVEC